MFDHPILLDPAPLPGRAVSARPADQSRLGVIVGRGCLPPPGLHGGFVCFGVGAEHSYRLVIPHEEPGAPVAPHDQLDLDRHDQTTSADWSVK
jgi:hypothetical protein